MTRQITSGAFNASNASALRDCLLFRADLSGRPAIRDEVFGASVSPSTLPRGWAVLNGRGLTTAVTGVGVAGGGLTYVDIRISGTPSSTGAYQQRIGSITEPNTAQLNTVWTASAYTALLSGSFTNVGNVLFSVGEHNAAGDLIGGALNTPDTKAQFTGNFARISTSYTMANVLCNRASNILSVNVTSGNAVDFTLRIAAPETQRLGGIVAFNSGLGSIVWNQVTYLGVGSLGSISAIEESADIQAASVKVTLSGIPTALISAALNEPYQNKPCYIYHAFFDTSTGALIPDPVLLFEGELDTMEIGVGDSAVITVSCENILARWQRPNIRRWTPIEHKRRYPGDLGFDFVTESSEVDVFWGRPSV